MRTDHVDALDLEIVDALQRDPRAGWTSVGTMVDRSPVSVARRWNRMSRAHLAWTGIALHPAASQGAFIEVSCSHANLSHVIENLSRYPDIITVGTTTGDFNLYCILIGVSLPGILRRINEDIIELRLCERTRINLFHQITGGVDWRQEIVGTTTSARDAPPPSEVMEEFQNLHQSTRGVTQAPSASFRPLFLALGADARRPLNQLAEELGSTTSTVKRMVTQLQSRRQAIFRCDVARPLFDYPISTILSLRTPPEFAEELAFRIGGLKETRFCASVASTANVIVVAGLRSLLDGENFTSRIALMGIPAEIASRSISMRMAKVYGRILDNRGRSRLHIPVDPWAAEVHP
ncbi:Lrp/AsnC family transcriptional regulator [Corynebacterium pacaense]|uniref:Lrp/AsnC family transcriptional regulator n=1 Tax=Corynebacterium pacaense TaxID=1816684 RepID=UPI0015C41AED|nr:AsnC family transcriptional regulator [Corynebacterium pacaense]